MVEGKEQYHGKIENRFTVLENIDAEIDINRARETIRENLKISIITMALSNLKNKSLSHCRLTANQLNRC